MDDPRAKVFRQILDGSKAQGWAFVGALREAVEALVEQHRAEKYQGTPSAPRLQRVDGYVLKGMLKCLDFKTGELYPSYETIARKAAVSRSAVVESIKRLKAYGVLDWVRRTVVAETVGEAGPQREQTSNAYHFDSHRYMEKRVRQTFLKALARNLKKLGGLVVAKIAAPPPKPKPSDPALEASLARLEAALNSGAERGSSASPENGLYPQVGITMGKVSLREA